MGELWKSDRKLPGNQSIMLLYIGDDVVVIVNMGDRSYDSYSLGFPRGGTWKVRFNSDWCGYSPDFGNHPGYDTFAEGSNPNNSDGMPFRANVGIGAYSVLILSQ
ncbi:MAG: alpha amylase C-terminal domain-containing protein [Desmonostoc geniculatum HA4340-LM1]|jgi:1,4-alpha-glucan branching enzyme|nr:alpha amylase C-terminal domain-containing protein [Desmonostoc geniculatum HA4340-LM1]